MIVPLNSFHKEQNCSKLQNLNKSSFVHTSYVGLYKNVANPYLK